MGGGRINIGICRYPFRLNTFGFVLLWDRIKRLSCMHSGGLRYQCLGVQTRQLLNYNISYTPELNKNIKVFIISFDIQNYSSSAFHQPVLNPDFSES